MTAVAPRANRIADGWYIMHPFRNLPAAIDRVTCGTCGKPAWDHFVTEAGVECETPDSNGACRYFSIAGFHPTIPVLCDDVRLSQSA